MIRRPRPLDLPPPMCDKCDREPAVTHIGLTALCRKCVLALIRGRS